VRKGPKQVIGNIKRGGHGRREKKKKFREKMRVGSWGWGTGRDLKKTFRTRTNEKPRAYYDPGGGPLDPKVKSFNIWH